MLSFFLNGYRFLKIIFNGIKNDEEFRFLFIFIVVLLIGSTAFYVNVEQWRIVDALYFSVMTMATVGYGDLVPSTDIGKVFTMLYAFLSIGAFVSITAKSVQMTFLNAQEKKQNFAKRKEAKAQQNQQSDE